MLTATLGPLLFGVWLAALDHMPLCGLLADQHAVQGEAGIYAAESGAPHAGIADPWNYITVHVRGSEAQLACARAAVAVEQ